ncbi:MAG: cytochrome b N-terminal domain-containing protein, partial [Deltaproteobacteria bacterium]|nr:cytochrome b N-terminal domain-containing protein [Deltaproteobacteria bacterium]
MLNFDKVGQMTIAALLASIGSGFVVAYQYEVAHPFVTSVAIEAILPFGAFWRALHFWTSQAFFLLLIYHAWQSIDDLPKISMRPSSRRQWTVLSLTFPMSILALFTGYVLRYDGTGQAAGTIAEHLLLKIPLIGSGLNRFLMASTDEGLSRIYLLHLLLTALLWGLGTWYHTRRVILSRKIFMSVLAGSIAVAILFHAPIDLPGKNIDLIQGPWFFLGIQELLRLFPPLGAGILYPLIPVIAFSSLPWASNRKIPFSLLIGWL